LAAAVVWWRCWVGHEFHLVGFAPCLEERVTAQFLGWPAFGIGDKFERRAAALCAVVVPCAFFQIEDARAVGVVAIPAKRFVGAVVGFAPELDASRLAVNLEVGDVNRHARPHGSIPTRRSGFATCRRTSSATARSISARCARGQICATRSTTAAVRSTSKPR